MIQIGNTLCVSFPMLSDIGITKSQYDKWCQRQKIKVVQRACFGKPAMIAYDSLPQPVKEQLNIIHGKPAEQARKKGFKDCIGIDPLALSYYNNFTYERNGVKVYLSEDTRRQYCTNANILNAIWQVLHDAIKTQAACGDRPLRFWQDMGQVVNQLQKELGHSLPSNHRELKKKFDEYHKDFAATGMLNYDCLISKKFGNTNSVKLFNDAKDWLVAKYALPIKIQIPQLWEEYNQVAELEGWNKLDDESTIYKYLMQPDVVKLWYAGRHGKVEAYKKLSVQLKTRLPEVRNVLWYSDGTKMNFFFKRPGATAKGDYTAQATVYLIIDVYSEAVLGWSVAPKSAEDHEMQLLAIRQAMQVSGQKPEEWRYDGQGGHSKIESNRVFKTITGLSFKTKPHNPRGKTIESLFGRIQQHVQREEWFYTGQNITSKRLDSKANMEYILANLQYLPTYEEAVERFGAAIEKWNWQRNHHKYGKPHMELYQTSENKHAQPFEVWDAINAFYVRHETRNGRGIEYKTDGLRFEFKGKKYHYEVYQGDGIDWAFVDSYLGQRFTVKYDVYDMSQVALYLDGPNGEQFVAIAETHREVGRATRDNTTEQRQFIHAVLDTNDARMKQNEAALNQIFERTGIHPDKLIAGKAPKTLGEVMKQESYMDAQDDNKELVPVEVTPKRKKSIYDKF